MQETKIIKKEWDKINPLSFESYLNVGGFKKLKECVSGVYSSEEIIGVIKDSGLKGRGGGGFSTGKKWEIARMFAKKNKKEPFFIVNGDESQPGTFKDKLIIEKNPFSLIEGALIGAFAIGASKVYLYINGNYKEQIKILQLVVNALYENKILGYTLGNSKNSFEVRVIRGAGGYIFGEESTLINSIEGKRGEPRIRPPFPPEEGLFGSPTVVNNVETIANIVPILEMGADIYRKIGTKHSPGTKLFCVSGPIKKTGVFEFPLGISLREIIYGYCMGLERGKKLAFVQAGSIGSFFRAKELDYRMAYENGKELINVGLGDILVVDDNASIEDLFLSFAEFFQRESCGQCTPCREGNYQLLKIAERLKDKKLLKDDWENLNSILMVLTRTSLCPLGRFSAQSWMGLIKFKGERFFKTRMRK